MAELQKDPMTRGDFLGLGLMGTIVGAVLTIPPVAFILSPIIKTNVLGQSNVTDDWQEVGSVSEIKPLRTEALVTNEATRRLRRRAGLGRVRSSLSRTPSGSRGGTRSSRKADRGPSATSWEGACAPTSWTRRARGSPRRSARSS